MESKGIKISRIVAAKLDQYKKGDLSYSQVINSFLDYFEITGFKPSDLNTSTLSLIKNFSERNIAILKNIENKKIDPIHLMVEQILDHIKNGSPKPEIKLNNSGISDEDVQGLVIKIEALERNLQTKEMENKDLHGRLAQVKTVNLSENHIENFKKIKELIKQLDDDKAIPDFKKTHIQIEKNLWRRNYDSIINLINNVS
jgi:hypothetical protein